MTVKCSLSLLLRIAFWLWVVALLIGVALGSAVGTAPANPVSPEVATYGKEVD
ncbi:hypothetical protein AB0E55_25565 [Amycolatopsis keratiniphila]|uniref:hypothetical protein n=1 Tax=Amycolatopsis keratiniphila TaxID=129921 RepID=UPI00087A8EAB|nr:hypothetical protein [Amycolatopsis keratiniphila]SDU27791.1 hypothetical protein SAMN04489733_2646 [Amycolatopsis keratiniphila]